MTKQHYLSTDEAAAYLGMSPRALRMAIHRGHLSPTGKIGSRLLFTTSDLDQQVQAGKMESKTEPVDLPIAANEDREMPPPTTRKTPMKRRRPGGFNGSVRENLLRRRAARNTSDAKSEGAE